MKRFLVIVLFILGSLNGSAFSLGDSTNFSFLDSLYESVKKDVDIIEAQLEENDQKRENGDSLGLKYVFNASKFLVLGDNDPPVEHGKHIYFGKVNKKSYGITDPSDETNINNILKALDAPPYDRRLVVYITSIFAYPEYESGLKSSAGVEAMVKKCESIISSKAYTRPFANKDFTTILVIKIYGAYTKEGIDRDENYESLNIYFQVKHRFRFLFDHQTPAQCKKDIEISVKSQSPSSMISFIENVSNVYKNLNCDPKAKSNGISKYSPVDIKINCSIDSYELKEKIRTKNCGSILAYCLNFKKPTAKGTSISTPGGSVSKESTEEDKKYALAKYKKVLKECLSVQERILAITSLLKATEVNDVYEEVILDFIKNIKDSDISTFLAELKKNNLLNNLISSIDDEVLWMGGSNYTGLITELKVLIEKSPEFSEKLDKLYQPHVIENRIINWGNKYGTYSFAGTGSIEKGAIRKKSVSLGENGIVTVSREVLSEITLNEGYIVGQDYTGDFNFYTYNWSALPNLNLDPYEPVIFINHTNLTILDQANGVQKGEMTIVPAIFLEYARQKNLSDDVFTTGFVVLDVASLVSGVGTLPNIAGKLTYLKRAYVILEIANASVNLAFNLTDIEIKYSELKPIVEASNAFLIATSVFDLGRKITKARTVSGALRSGEVLKNTSYEQNCRDFVTSINANEKSIRQVLVSTANSSHKKALEELLAMRDDMVRKFGGEWKNLGKVNVGIKSIDDLKAYWNSLTTLPPKTSSKTYTLWRRVDISWEPAVTHPAQIFNTENRYSRSREAIYFGTSREVTDAEWLFYNPDYGLKGKNGSKLYQFEVDQDGLLDLTNNEVLKKLNIDESLLIKSVDKEIPQTLGDWAYNNGYKGIIFPSARKVKETNVVIFKYFEGSVPPGIKNKTLIETIE